MTKKIIPALAGALLALLLPLSASLGAAQDWKTRLERPQQSFVFYQLNAAGGYDSAEDGDGWGLADRGPRTQLTLEWLSKDRDAIQRGYTAWISPSAWNLKLALELDPVEGAAEDIGFGLRLLDTWVQLSTRWDRTRFVLGHRSLPYGHNPSLDSQFSFLPNQASSDLGFGRDTGVYFSTPLAPRLDLEVALTAGGFLSGPILVAEPQEGGGYELDDRLRYRGSWLVVSRLGRPSFERREIGVFVAAGSTHTESGPLTDLLRVGTDWVVKIGEDWTSTQQVSVGRNRNGSSGDRRTLDVLNRFEVFLGPRWRIGASHGYHREDPEDGSAETRETGTLRASFSYALTRDSRVRLNPFTEYLDSTGERSSGVLLQVCTGCGWRK